MFVIFMVFYLFIGLAGYSVNSKINCGACKLTQTSQVKKNNNNNLEWLVSLWFKTEL